MHSPMAKSVEINEMPEDIDQYTKVVESRTRGIELMVAIRAEALGNGDGIRMLTREDKRDLLEAWEDLQVKAEDGGNSSKVASLEQECDRLTEALRLADEERAKLRGDALFYKEKSDLNQVAYASNSKLLTDERQITSKLQHENSQLRAELKEQRKELSVLRRALNAANGVVGHFTGRK